ncbi:MAG TPA: glycerol-3-phosphate 1-O-acyltransferase PlsY [Chthoniobacterales bacterium]|jgi:glycerol-3-phosphate acyltransferase PlsY
MTPAVALIVSAVSAFLLGSIPNGFLIAKAKGIDIREHGSKNIGATNVLRVLGKGCGYTVFALDALKGAAAVLLGGFLTGWQPDHMGQIIAAISCILGHSYTPWLGFKGGKGVATTAGVLLTLFHPAVLLIVLAVWVIFFYSTRFVSVASLAAALGIPLAVWFLVVRGNPQGTPIMIFSVVVCLLVFLRHKANIARLINGTETRFSKKK